MASTLVAMSFTAMTNGQKVTGADASFYMHEVAESTAMKPLMARGMSFSDAYDIAHPASLQKYQVSPFSVYHPDVIRQVNLLEPGSFNNNWIEFWSNL